MVCRPTVAVLVGLALTVAACGGGDGRSTAAGPTTVPPAATTAPPIDRQTILTEGVTSCGAPGGLALVRSGGQGWTGVHGNADLAGTPVDIEMRFRIASITKPIVATLVLREVAAGTLGLDEDVAQWVPELQHRDQPATVRMLLGHTSGVFDEGSDGDPVADIARLTDPTLIAEAQELMARYPAGERVIASDRLLVALAETHERSFAPGTGYRYSNTNYQLAAMVVRAVTGSSLAELLDAHIARPLGLTRTTIAPPDLGSPELRGYGTAVADGSLVDVTDDLLAFGNGGSGGVLSTAQELATIIAAIVDGTLLPPELTALMQEPSAPSVRASSSYGLGLARYELSCGTFCGHEGGVNGTASIAMADRTGERIVVVALNLRSGGDPQLPAVADRLVCAGS